MKITAIAAVLALTCFSIGCVPSLNPLYTDSSTVFEPALLGVWTEPDQAETWQITHSGNKEYKLLHTDENGKVGRFTVRLVRIDDKLFLDLAPAEPRMTENDFYKSHFLATHTFVHISRSGDSFQLSTLEPAWIRAQLQRSPTAISHIAIEDGIILTGSTKELQNLVSANVNTPGAFSEPTILKRKEKR